MKLKLIFISLFICSIVSAQDFAVKKKLADKYYSRYDFYEAIPMYEQLLITKPGDYAVYEKLADSYRKINDSRNAARCYEFLIDTSEVKKEYILYYAQAAARNGEYENSAKAYQKYAEKDPADPRGTLFSATYKNISSFYKDSASYFVSEAPFCSVVSDFSPAYFGNRIVFSSARRDTSVVRMIYNWTHSSYLDLFISAADTGKTIPFSGELNSKYHEGPVTFSKNLDTIIFTRSNFYKRRFRKSIEGINKLNLFQATWDKLTNRWTDIIPLSFNSDQYSVGHPALSADGKTLYFASDMPGGMGETDIYATHLITESGKKSWSKPENLGEKINTRGREMFPSLDNSGNLWYASNGQPGLGGLDVFMALKDSEGFKSPVNPGYPINTRFDDFGFISQNEGNDGYLSSDRFNAIGDDDIFLIKRTSKTMVIQVYDSKSHKAIQSASLLITSQGQGNEKIISDENGQGTIGLNFSKSYMIVANKDLYEENIVEIPMAGIGKADTIRIAMVRRAHKINVEGKVLSAVNFNSIPNSTAWLINKADSSKKAVLSDGTGTFSFELQAETDYIIEVSVSSSGSKCSSSPIEISTRGFDRDTLLSTSFSVFCVGDIIKVEDIYYDLGKYNIRPDAALELDKVLDIMNRYPKMKIELRSHTDSRGTAASNMVLSERRANAAAEYLFSKGVSRDRITGKGYGETLLLNQCAEGVRCTEEEHQVNRRTEFKILAME